MPIARDEVQTLTVTATGGTYTLTTAYGTTTPLAWDATPLAITGALNLVATTPPHAFRVTGSGPYAIRFKGPTVRHAAHPLITAGTGSLTGGTATIVRAVAGQAGDRTSIRVTGNKLHVSVNAAGGDTSTILADATSFSFFLRMRVRKVAGEQFVGGLSSHLGGSTGGVTMGVNVVVGGAVYTVQWVVIVNNGTSIDGVSWNVAGFEAPGPGEHQDVTVAFTGELVGDQWKMTKYDRGQSVIAGTTDAPAGNPNLGPVGSATRVFLGVPALYGGYDAQDNTYDDLYIWKNRILTPLEVSDITNGVRDIGEIHPADLVVAIDGDGEAGVAVAPGDPGIVNRAGLNFDTIDALSVNAGTTVYDVSLVAQPIIPLSATVMRSGKTLAIVMGLPEGATSLSGFGTPALPYPTPPAPTITINGGPPITLVTPVFPHIYGPTYLLYSLTGANGPPGLVDPIEAGDTVTFTVPSTWLSAYVDGTLAKTIGYTDEPATIEAGTPLVLPEGRTFQYGQNLIFRTAHASYKVEGFGPWNGGTLDADGEMTGLTTVANRTLNNNYFLSPGLGWGAGWAEEPAIRYGYPNLPPGRYCLTWEGVYNFGTTNPDRLDDLGASTSYGPWAGKSVSWLDTTTNGRVDLEPVERAGTEAEPHLAYFDVRYIAGNTGHPCVDSWPTGDDFVRPCPATSSYLRYTVDGTASGTPGARKNLQLYHLGPVGAEWYDPADGAAAIPEFYPPMVQCLRDSKPAILRAHYDVFDSCQLSPPGLHMVARWDEPQRGITEYEQYPDGGFDSPIVSVANYTSTGPDDPNIGMIPPTNFGCLMVVETGVPHTLREGARCGVKDFAGSPTSLPVADNGATGGQDVWIRGYGLPWRGLVMIVQRVISPTKFLVFTASNHSLTAHVQLATSPMTTGLGNVVIPWNLPILFPDELVRLAVEVECDKVWLSMPFAFSDDDIRAVYARFAQAMAGNSVKVLAEISNETWNSMFIPFVYPQCAARSMPGTGAAFSGTVSGGALVSGTVTAPGSGYFYGHDGWHKLTVAGEGTGAAARAHFEGGVATSVEVVAGGTGYSSITLTTPPFNSLVTTESGGRMHWMAVMTWKMAKLARQAFTTAGIDHDRLMFADPIQNWDSGMANEFLDYYVKAGWPVDDLYFCPTNYDAANYAQHNDPYRWKTDDLDQTIDRNIASFRWHAAMSNWARDFKDWAVGAGYGSIPIYAYEGGITSVLDSNDPYGPKDPNPAVAGPWAEAWGTSWRIISHPRYYEVEAERAMALDGSIDVETRFNYQGDANAEATYVHMWSMAHVPSMQAGRGDGSDGKYVNATDPFDWNRVVAVNMQFFGDWSGGDAVDGPLASGPPVASLITNTTYRVTAADPTGGTPPYAYDQQRWEGSGWVSNGLYGKVWDVTGATPETDYTHQVVVYDTSDPYQFVVTGSLAVRTTGEAVPLALGVASASAITETTFLITCPDATGGVPPYPLYSHELFYGGDWHPAGTGQSQGFGGLAAATTYRTRAYVTDSASDTAMSPELEVTTAGGEPPPGAPRPAAVRLARRSAGQLLGL